MKFRLIAAALLTLLAMAVGCMSYFCLRQPMPASAEGDTDALLWLRHEFKLPAEKMQRIQQMHDAYQIACEEHCRNIRDARGVVKKLREANAPSPEIAVAEAKSQEFLAVCNTSTEAHMRDVARVMGGAEGDRYLSIVLPRIAQYEHGGAPNLDLKNQKPQDGTNCH